MLAERSLRCCANPSNPKDNLSPLGSEQPFKLVFYPPDSVLQDSRIVDI